jgi:GNAT superfamily N-acetyltransferase
MSEPILVRPVAATDAAELAALFLREGSPCFCRYWHFGGTNKEWEARCALEPQRNRVELEEALTTGNEDARGLVATAENHNLIIGWAKLVPQRVLPKLLARVPYRGLDDPDVFSLGCFLVDPAHRRQGVARALLEAALQWAPRWGARFLEAYPRVAEGLHEGEMWTGPASIFAALGFEVHRLSPQYPVLRKRVG